MSDPKIARAPRRMERIGLKQEGARQRGLGGEEDRSLPAPVGVPAEEEAAARVLGEDAEGGTEPFTIPRGPCGRRRPACTSLAERQITAEDGDPPRDEGLSHGHEERPLGVATGSVGEHEAVGTPRPDGMQDAANGRVGLDLDALNAHVTFPREPHIGGRDATRQIKETQAAAIERLPFSLLQ